ncbi:hypothetical protein HYW17_01975 [Candidatus Uhrbacteria bacterium]|nr:hypothetical protein [Candidatus Uhrbacteria bacterium]
MRTERSGGPLPEIKQDTLPVGETEPSPAETEKALKGLVRMVRDDFARLFKVDLSKIPEQVVRDGVEQILNNLRKPLAVGPPAERSGIASVRPPERPPAEVLTPVALLQGWRAFYNERGGINRNDPKKLDAYLKSALGQDFLGTRVHGDNPGVLVVTVRQPDRGKIEFAVPLHSLYSNMAAFFAEESGSPHLMAETVDLVKAAVLNEDGTIRQRGVVRATIS